MKPLSSRQRQSRRRGVLWLAVVVCVIVVCNVLTPARDAASGVLGRVISASFGQLQSTDDRVAAAEKARLREQVRADQVQDAQSVVDQARRLTGSYPEGLNVRIGRVIALSPTTPGTGEHKVQLNIGSADGVKPDHAVVAPGGLVGRVTAVSDHTTTVTLISDASAVVGARDERTRALGRVSGLPANGVSTFSRSTLTYTVSSTAQLKRGDRLVTAGSPGDTPYPSGLTIGVIASVDSDRGQAERTATVTPSANLAALDVVGVLTGGSS